MSLPTIVLVPLRPGDAPEDVSRFAQAVQTQDLRVCLITGQTDLAAPQHCAVVQVHPSARRGEMLRAGLHYAQTQGAAAVVTTDSHLLPDADTVLRMAQAAGTQPPRLQLAPDGAHYSAPQRLLAACERLLLRLMYGISVSQVHTTLRAYPLEGSAAQQPAAGKGYDFEMHQLVLCTQLWQGAAQHTQGAAAPPSGASGFRTVRDGFFCLAALLRHLPSFFLSSLLSFCVDYALFTLFLYGFSLGVVPATVAARLLSGSLNFTVNKHLVFRSSGKAYNLPRYLVLAACILGANALLMYAFTQWGAPALLAKVFVEGLLYSVSFLVQTYYAHRES